MGAAAVVGSWVGGRARVGVAAGLGVGVSGACVGLEQPARATWIFTPFRNYLKSAFSFEAEGEGERLG